MLHGTRGLVFRGWPHGSGVHRNGYTVTVCSCNHHIFDLLLNISNSLVFEIVLFHAACNPSPKLA